MTLKEPNTSLPPVGRSGVVDPAPMTFVVNEQEYELLRVSTAEGMALELWIVDAPAGPIAQVYYREVDGSMTFSAFEREVPFELVEKLVSNAREALLPIATAKVGG